jgi:hypothetical protein
MREARPTKLDPFKAYVERRVMEAAPDWIPAPAIVAAGIQPYLPGTLWHSAQAPDLMLQNLNVLSGQANSGVVKLPGIPSNWSTSGLHP